MITGPNGPFTNIPPAIETHIEFITKLIANAEKIRADGVNPAVEPNPHAEIRWGKECEAVASNSLIKLTDSWIFGTDDLWKYLRFFFGGLQEYWKRLQEVINSGCNSYRP